MRIRFGAAIVVSVLAAGVTPVIAQPPTCSSSAGTMTCTFPAPSGGGSSQWTSSGADISTANSGNVGIGNTSPLWKLDVMMSGLNKQAIRVLDGQNIFVSLGTTTNAVSGGDDATIVWGANGVKKNLRFMAATNLTDVPGSSGMQEFMQIAANGNVGIGTRTPGEKLAVNGKVVIGADATEPSGWAQLEVRGTGEIDIYGTAASIVDFKDGDPVGYDGRIRYEHATRRLEFYTAQGQRMTIDNTGNIGIGTVTPTQRLQVVGNIAASGALLSNYQDVAEWVRAKHPLDAGTVVSVSKGDRNVVDASAKSYDTAAVGVVSQQPGVVLGEAGDDKVLVAQSGRVKVKVDASYGAVEEGDLLVTSPTPGVAMKSEPLNVGGAMFHRPGTLLGKALEPLPNGEGEILVLLTLQ